MESFSWLHLTDFHQGMGLQHGWLWPNVREELFDDLARLHDRCGPWNAVLFTGDLTQRGEPAEFDEFDKTLGQIWSRLESLGSRPQLLVVPGNHDLVRPPDQAPLVQEILKWTSDGRVPDTFWSGKDASLKVVDDAFAPYVRWKRGVKLPTVSSTTGLVPGDFAATIALERRRIGVLGLNSAFLQLAAGDYRGRLALGLPQFHAACGGDGPEWALDHELCLLLTHHPPDWLSEESRRALTEEISPKSRFALHLYGHMHDADAPVLSSLGGHHSRRHVQGRSLFGLEKVNESIQRSHGYNAGRLEFKDGEAALRIWPRRAERGQAGGFTLRADVYFELEPDEGTRSERIPLRPLRTSRHEATRVSDHLVLLTGGMGSPSDDSRVVIACVAMQELGLLSRVAAEVRHELLVEPWLRAQPLVAARLRERGLNYAQDEPEVRDRLLARLSGEPFDAYVCVASRATATRMGAAGLVEAVLRDRLRANQGRISKLQFATQPTITRDAIARAVESCTAPLDEGRQQRGVAPPVEHLPDGDQARSVIDCICRLVLLRLESPQAPEAAAFERIRPRVRLVRDLDRGIYFSRWNPVP